MLSKLVFVFMAGAQNFVLLAAIYLQCWESYFETVAHEAKLLFVWKLLIQQLLVASYPNTKAISHQGTENKCTYYCVVFLLLQ